MRSAFDAEQRSTPQVKHFDYYDSSLCLLLTIHPLLLLCRPAGICVLLSQWLHYQSSDHCLRDSTPGGIRTIESLDRPREQRCTEQPRIESALTKSGAWYAFVLERCLAHWQSQDLL